MIKRNVDWRLYNLIEELIKEELDTEDLIYMDTDNIEIEIDGYDVVFHIPVEYGESKVNIELTISPDFDAKIRIKEMF